MLPSTSKIDLAPCEGGKQPPLARLQAHGRLHVRKVYCKAGVADGRRVQQGRHRSFDHGDRWDPARFGRQRRAESVETKVDSHNNSQNYQKKAEPREL